jgi:uncharacterized protein YegP (UPF0339 family)
MKFEIYKDRAGEWRWRLRSRNERIVAVSSESYKRKDGATQSVGLVQDTTGKTPVHYLR